MTLQKIAQRQWHISERNGWHNKTPLEYLALICSEIGEACNECRGIKPTDKLGGELADIIIRVLDLTIEHSIDIDEEIENKLCINLSTDNKDRLK